MKKLILAALCLTGFAGSSLKAQNIGLENGYFTYNRGFGIHAPDSLFSINMRFRIQNRIAATSMSGTDLRLHEWEAIVRRLRLRFDGHVYSPRFTYTLQLSFSRGDMDWDNTGFPNIIRDAMLFYKFNKSLAIGMGQTKLPGNRQRINSSGELQFVDRSTANAIFNIDRDFGIQVYHEKKLGSQFTYYLRAAVSSGDGRNVARTDNGFAYSTRLELFPLGKFRNGGDYIEADLEREPTPKIALAGFYFYDDRATRNGGTIGKAMPAGNQRSFANYGGDFLLKYRGLSVNSEYIHREAARPLTDVPSLYVFNGYGVNNEVGYVFTNNWGIAGRVTHIRPRGIIYQRQYELPTDYYTIGISKYINGHKLKIQGDITFKDVLETPVIPSPALTDNWQFRIQMQLGI